MSGCGGPSAEAPATAADDVLALPPLEAADLESGRLEVVATTSIIGDVVANVGGTAIELTVLMRPGQDPHSYEPSAAELTAAAAADVLLVNGWDLEGGLVDDLTSIAERAVIVPVNAGVEPLAADEDEHHEADEEEHEEAHGGANPHTWLDPHTVRQWVGNIQTTLSQLDPAHAEEYEANAERYLVELDGLIAYYDEQVSRIPEAQRKLVTTHSTLAYFAERYDFEVVGTVLPASSAVAEPSAAGLAQLVEAMEEAGVCVIFTETTTSDQLAQALAGELEGCERVEMLSLYTDALGPVGSSAETYIGMMRHNIDAIVEGLL